MVSRFLPRAARIGGLCALVGLGAPGCDLLNESDVLSDVSSADRSDIADALSISLDCDADVASLTGSDGGTLDEDDCSLGDGSFADFYAFTVEETADVTVRQDSDDFPPYLSVFDVDLDDDTEPFFEVALDANSSSDDSATIRETLGPGLYLVVVNSVSSDQVGDYDVSIEADVDDSDDSDNKVGAAGTAKPLTAKPLTAE